MRLENRLVLYFTGGVVLLMTGVMAVVVSGPSQILREQATKRAIALGKFLASSSINSLSGNDWADLAQQAKNVAEGDEVAGAIIVDRQGRVLVDTRHPDRFGEHEKSLTVPPPSETISCIVPSPEDGAEVVDVLEPVYLDRTRSPDTFLGTVRLRLSLRSIESQTQTLQIWLILIGLLAAILGTVSAKIFARRITKPIDSLVDATLRVVHGDLETRVGIQTHDEIGKLSRNFDRMTAEILQERERIHDLNRRLEGEVRERTKELVLANESLEHTNENLNRTLQDLKTAQTHLVQSEKMASLGQLVAGVVHEINNPLNFIYNGIPPLAEMIEEIRGSALCAPQPSPSGQTLDVQFESATELLQALRDGAKRAATIVKDLRSFSRLDESERKMGNVHEGIETTLNLLAYRLRGRIRVVRDYGTIPPFEFYPALLNQVFMNLLANAEEAIEGSGEIRIRTRLENTSVIIQVEDTGSGIPPEIQSRIFEPFFSTKTVGKGMGLGLSITYGIVQKHGGTITVESDVGKGTRFTIRIPTGLREAGSPGAISVS